MSVENKEALAEELYAKARALVPTIKERAQEAEDNSHVHDETMAAIVDAGLLRVLQSKDYGGYELDPEVFYTIQSILAEADMSVAWLYGVLGVHPWQIALFDKTCQDEIYGENGSKADTIVASTYMLVLWLYDSIVLTKDGTVCYAIRNFLILLMDQCY